MAKNAFKDKVSNTIFIMKFLDSKGGIDLVREYFTLAIPDYVLEYQGFGGATKWVMRQWLRASSRGYMGKILQKLVDDGEFLQQSFEVMEDTQEKIVSKIDCKFMRGLVKEGKKCACEFDIREYYCENACLPLLTKLLSDIYLSFEGELTKEGCIHTVKVDKSKLKKDETEEKEN